MGNICRRPTDDTNEWRKQNQAPDNPVYKYVNLERGGKLIDAYMRGGRKEVLEMARQEILPFLYNKGKGMLVTKERFADYKRQTLNVDSSVTNAQLLNDGLNIYEERHACWDLAKRGGVGETPFLLLYLMNTAIHTKVAKILLKLYPTLALDVYEGNEYFGESALHIAAAFGNMKGVRALVNKGAYLHQRATGSFFLPEDVKGATNKGLTYYGEYPLAFAAVFDHFDIYDYLIRKGANPDLRDSFGNTVLHMIVNTDRKEMFKYAVRHHTCPANMHIANNEGLTPLALASKLGRATIFKEMLELGSVKQWQFSNIICSVYPLSALDTIGPDGETDWNSALMFIVNGETDQHLNMLEGEVIDMLLNEKWEKYASRRFFERLLLALLHLIMLSIAIYLRPASNLMAYRDYKDAIRYVAEVAVCIGCSLSIVMHSFEIKTQGILVFAKNCRHAPARTVFLIACVIIMCCVPIRLLSLALDPVLLHKIEDVLLIIATPASWFFLLFFARGVKLTGPFVTMIFKMIGGDLFRFGIIFVVFLLGFMQAFYFLFRDIPDTSITSFLTLPGTIMTLFQMTFGEFKYDEFGDTRYAVLTKVVFAVFMILVPILLLNMLIAMMGNTYQLVISKSEKEWKKQWAQIVVVLERTFTRASLKKYRLLYSKDLVRTGNNNMGDYAESNVVGHQRAIMVIKPMPKTQAQQHKDAITHWKRLGKEVIHRLKDGIPIDSEVPNPQPARQSFKHNIMTDVVEQQAWIKDVDLQLTPEKKNSIRKREKSDNKIHPIDFRRDSVDSATMVDNVDKFDRPTSKGDNLSFVDKFDTTKGDNLSFVDKFDTAKGDNLSLWSRGSDGSTHDSRQNVDEIIGRSNNYFTSHSGKKLTSKIYRKSTDSEESPFRAFNRAQNQNSPSRAIISQDNQEFQLLGQLDSESGRVDSGKLERKSKSTSDFKFKPLTESQDSEELHDSVTNIIPTQKKRQQSEFRTQDSRDSLTRIVKSDVAKAADESYDSLELANQLLATPADGEGIRLVESVDDSPPSNQSHTHHSSQSDAHISPPVPATVHSDTQIGFVNVGYKSDEPDVDC